MKNILDANYKYIQMCFLFFLAALSIGAWYVYYTFGLTTVYNDSMSHLNISRFVFDNLEPGFAQLGGVWLPIPHVLPMFLVWNNWAWHSGFAGGFFSMIAYGLSTIGIYKMLIHISKSRIAALTGAIIFAVNLNLLYLQTTALTEPLYLCFFVLSALAFVGYVVKDNAKYLFLLGLFGFLQVLTRYDGWFVVMCEAGMVIFYERIIRKSNLSDSINKLTVFLFPSVFGIALWLLWNLLIFGDPLFFALGPYSAHSQQTDLATKAGLITKGSVFYSVAAYCYAVLDNVGIYSAILGIVGSIYYLFSKVKEKVSIRLLIILFLATPIIFNVLALFLGFSVLNLPELGWNRSSEISGQWFNVRYGILALPFFAVFGGLLVRFWRPLALVILLVIGLQVYQMGTKGLITIVDGTIGSSSFDNYDIGKVLKKDVKPGEKVILSTSFFNSVAFVSSLPLNQFIHEGVSREWQPALDTPQNYAQWVVMANGDTGEAAYNNIIKKKKDLFLANYNLYYSGKHAYIFKKKDLSELSVRREGENLFIGNEKFNIKGVNSYALAYMSDQDIDKTLKNLSGIGVNTVRFWVFGDGNEDGFQPESGVFNETRLKKTDLILSLAQKYNIRVIPTLVNNWEDYGGKDQYEKWLGINEKKEPDAFYTNKNVENLFKNYINHIVTRENKLTKVSYNKDSTILAWDLMNEPRFEGDDSKVVSSWVGRMGDYVKSLDSTHLLMVGTERTASVSAEKHAINICDQKDIDICSMHLYLYDKEKSLFTSSKQVDNLLASQAKIAKSEKKPIILGEWGVPKDKKPFDEKPLQIMLELVEKSKNLSYNGYLVWNFAESGDDSFGFTFKDNSGYDLASLKSLVN